MTNSCVPTTASFLKSRVFRHERREWCRWSGAVAYISLFSHDIDMIMPEQDIVFQNIEMGKSASSLCLDPTDDKVVDGLKDWDGWRIARLASAQRRGNW